MTKTLRTIAAIAICLVALGGVLAADDWRFWPRWLARVPAMAGIAGNANAIPELRAEIAGHPQAIPPCKAQPKLQQAFADARDWLAERRTDAFLVWHDGCLVGSHYGNGHAATLRPAGAMAKSLVAIMVGRAIHQGAVESLDTPVARTLREWRGEGDRRTEITWRNLLAMHAGLQWYRQETSPFSDFQRIILAGNYAPRALALRAVEEPGRYYDYSAWTYDVAGLALARAGDSPYEAMVTRWLSEPLGLGTMRIYVDRPGGNVHANCCLYTRADDWIKLGALLVKETEAPRLLPAGYVTQMATPGPDQPNYGLGVWLGTPYSPRRTIASARNPYPTPVKSVIEQSEPFLADDVMTFEGVGQTKTWISPSHRLVIVRFGETPVDWDDAVVPNLMLKAIER